MDEKLQEIIGTVLFIALMIFVFAIQRNPMQDVQEESREPDFNSGMPCEIWEEWYEPQTSKESVQEEIWGEPEPIDKVESEGYRSDTGIVIRDIKVDTAGNYKIYGRIQETDVSDCGNAEEYIGGMTYEQETSTQETLIQNGEGTEELEITTQAEPEHQSGAHVPGQTEQTGLELHQVGQSIPELLARTLSEMGIDWWTPYAIAQMMLESGGNPYAENPNGLDKGLFQYRITYWTQPESIFDAGAQIRLYCSQVYARICAGLSVEEIISRHYTSDYITEINWEYVNAVLARMN